MTASFNKAGFNIAGNADAKYDKNDISKSVDSSHQFSIRPNINGDDVDSLLTTLTAISVGGMDDDATQYNKLAQSAQNILSGSQVDPVKAVVIPLSSVSAVAERFPANVQGRDLVPFTDFLNDIYMYVVGHKKELMLIEQQWRAKSHSDAPEMTWGHWEHCLNRLLDEMQRITNIHDMVQFSNAYLAVRDTKDWNADVLSASSFIDITHTGLYLQFSLAIVQPYYAMMNAIYSIPVVNLGDDVSSPRGECQGDCDHDGECAGGLRCWQRNGWSDPMPTACYGAAPDDHIDYCYDPMKGTDVADHGWNAGDHGLLGECQGDWVGLVLKSANSSCCPCIATTTLNVRVI